MQRSEHNVDHVLVAFFICQFSAYVSAYIRYLDTFHAIVYQLGSHVNIVNLKYPFLHTLTKNILEKL